MIGLKIERCGFGAKNRFKKVKKIFLFSIDKGQNACYNVTDKRVDRIFQIEKC